MAQTKKPSPGQFRNLPGSWRQGEPVSQPEQFLEPSPAVATQEPTQLYTPLPTVGQPAQPGQFRNLPGSWRQGEPVSQPEQQAGGFPVTPIPGMAEAPEKEEDVNLSVAKAIIDNQIASTQEEYKNRLMEGGRESSPDHLRRSAILRARDVKKQMGINPYLGEPEIGFFEWVRTQNWITRLPFVGPAATAAKYAQAELASRRLQAGTASEEDKKFILEFVRKHQEEATRGKTFLVDSAEVLTHAPAFMIELIASGIIGTPVAAVSWAALRKYGFKQWGKKLTGALVKALAKSGKAAGTYMAPRTISATMQRMFPASVISARDEQVLAEIINKPGDGFGVALGKGFWETTTEVLSEQAGGPAARGLAKIWSKMPQSVQRKAYKMHLLRRWLEAKGYTKGSFVGKFKEAIARGGWSGIPVEIGEERLGELLRIPIDGWKGVLDPRTAEGRRQLLVELVAFSAMQAGMVGVSLGAQLAEGKTDPRFDPEQQEIIKNLYDELVATEGEPQADTDNWTHWTHWTHRHAHLSRGRAACYRSSRGRTARHRRRSAARHRRGRAHRPRS